MLGVSAEVRHVALMRELGRGGVQQSSLTGARQKRGLSLSSELLRAEGAMQR
jgi:hypothetical protein